MYKSRQRTEPAEHEQDDPILTPDEMASAGRMSRTTWQRCWRFDPRVQRELIRLSSRRLGMRASAWQRILAEGASKP